jgi:uncharacterized protein (DUF2147 family)
MSIGSKMKRVRLRHWLAAAIGAMAMAPMATHAGGDAGSASGSAWRNPSNSVHIRLTPCGADRMCGTVIWASEKAKADARRGGTDQLVGANLFREFRRVSQDEYKGRVFVPDLNRTFSGQMKLQGDSMIGKGCVLGGLICKQQVWKRIS